MKKKEIKLANINNFKRKRTWRILKEVFNVLQIDRLQGKSQKYFREQENLRRCLKSDLEEKSKLKKRIHDLTLETKEKQLKIAEYENSNAIKSHTVELAEQKYLHESKQIEMLKQENKKLSKTIANLNKPNGIENDFNSI